MLFFNEFMLMRVSFSEAVNRLNQGQVVAVPTETVYGLAALLCQENAIGEIFRLKGRPACNPLIIHVGAVEQCLELCSDLPPDFMKLAAAFWPGPLTMILPIQPDRVPEIARAKLPTAAFRLPKHEIARQLLLATSPFVAPSANLSGSPSATKPEHVEKDFGAGFPLLDGGSSLHGVESTILAHVDGAWQIVRLGALTAKQIGAVLGYLPECAVQTRENPISPGQLLQHYAPKAKLTLSLNAYESCPQKRPVVVGYGTREYHGAKRVYLLGDTIDPEQAAYRLYALLRELDLEGVESAWVDMDIPVEGLWQTVRERLARASLSK